MGIYPATCSVCKKVFLWFSGNPSQICGECVNKSTQSAIEISKAWKNFKPTVPLGFTVATRKAIKDK